LAARYAENARRVVETAEIGDSRKKLIELSNYLVSRKY